MIGTQLIQNFMLLLVTYILIMNIVTCSTMERGTTKHDPRSGEDAVSKVKDDIISSSNSPFSSHDYTVDEQEAMNNKKDAIIQELKEEIHSLEIKHKVEKKEFNCQSMALVKALYAKDSGTQECMTLERKPIQLNEETLIFGFINRIRELEGNVYHLKDEKEKLKGEILTKDSVIEEYIGKERKYKEETENLKGEIETKDSVIEEYIDKERKYKGETDVITHENEAKIQALQNNIKSLQEGYQIVKENLKGEIRNKVSLIEEHIAKERKFKEENESLEKENRDLQNQIKTLKIQVTDKEAELQRYLPQNREGTWKKYSGRDVPEDGVVSDDKGSKVYVCRAEVDGDVVPGWILSSRKVCLVYQNGEVHRKSPYEVLVPNSSFEWIGCHGDDIPPLAVPGGQTKEGEVLYVGRVKHADGYYYVGKVQPALNGCYNRHPLVYGDFTIHPNYEILVWK